MSVKARKPVNSNSASSVRRDSDAPKAYDEASYHRKVFKLAVAGFIVSSLILVAKLAYSNHVAIKEVLFEKLLTKETVIEDGEVMFKYVWTQSLKYCYIWMPILCGICTSYFTGMIVFLDSDVPGVQPPSPFSPSKYRKRSGHTFHSNYIFPVLVGIAVTLYMYWQQFQD